ncbi:purple acid phosphatase family protein [Dyadobacter psychrotolerans]|uniref:Metallophosphoesterase family protein n=1 Tax=Dyadobacter psychrotolerans TaxID=2541721 RepID=A0A4R5DW12_9BACT|nr:metallophosphoesterase family protein [Dyadobacter psychrotolerans]TDE16570.1 metallophosphoesterase family protein [Dyadobacter psychrotolerans]
MKFKYLRSRHILALLFLNPLFITTGTFAQGNKTYPASKFPDRVILGFKGNPSVSQAVNWRTDSTVTEAIAAIHEADPSPDFQSKAKVTKALSQPTVLDGKTVLYHEANFTDLKPATQYMYRVGNGTQWSEWFHFTTASDKHEPVSFLYFGDAQNDLRSLWSRTIRGAYSTLPKANLMIHAGDLINRSNSDYEWGEWFEAGGWVNGMIPSLSTPGNHEYYYDKNDKGYLSMHWRPQFALPENGPDGLAESAYYIDYQGVRFIALNSQAALLDSSILDKQAAWFEKVVSDKPNRWTVVIHHHPIYSTKNGRDNDEWRIKMEPLYKKHNVDIVLQGHDHTYGRGINMPLGQSRKKPDGPIYVVSVSGPKMYDIGLQNWMDRAASNTQLYQVVTVDDNKLAFKAYTVNGDLYDSFDLLKDKKGQNTLVELSNSLKMQERLELPERYQKSFKEEELKEYNQRFQEYKKRKGLK